jgi:TonB family protein
MYKNAAKEKCNAARLPGSLVISLLIHLIFLTTVGSVAFSSVAPAKNGTGLLYVVLQTNRPASGDNMNNMAVTSPVQLNQSQRLPAPTTPTNPKQPEVATSQDSHLPMAVETTLTPGLMPGPWYYSARYLHRRPTPLRPITPAYPPTEENTAGHVTLQLMINEQGTVDSYQVMDSTPAGRFDEAVIAAFTHETYAPGLITGYPVKSQLIVDVMFEPGNEPAANFLQELVPLGGENIKPVPLVKQK